MRQMPGFREIFCWNSVLITILVAIHLGRFSHVSFHVRWVDESLWKCWSEVNKCTEAGGIFKFYVADWFALMNDKMGGDMKKIKVGDFHISIRFYPFIRIHHFFHLLFSFHFCFRCQDLRTPACTLFTCGSLAEWRWRTFASFGLQTLLKRTPQSSWMQRQSHNQRMSTKTRKNMKQQRETVRCLKTWKSQKQVRSNERYVATKSSITRTFIGS